jgi:hypothetical protein
VIPSVLFLFWRGGGKVECKVVRFKGTLSRDFLVQIFS